MTVGTSCEKLLKFLPKSFSQKLACFETLIPVPE